MLATLLSVAVLHWVILVTPGANVLVVSQLAAGGARRAACFAALGITVVAVIWASLAALGVHAVFVAHPHLRSLLQLAGGAYLCYLAIRLWRSAGPTGAEGAAGMSAFAAFRLGCRRRLKFDPPCRLNFDPGRKVGRQAADCGQVYP